MLLSLLCLSPVVLVSAAVESRWNESGGSVLWFVVLAVGGLAVLGSKPTSF